jgi:hypothetical protein
MTPRPQIESEQKRFEALLAATLALMTHYAESGCPHAAQRIFENLLQLSGLRDVPWEFRAVLAKLGSRWTLLRDHAVAACRNGAPLH